MNYAFIENGQIIEGPKKLPVSWKNISGLDKMSDEDLKELGWLQVVEINKEFNPKIQVQSGPIFTIQEDDVLATYTNTNKPLQDVKDYQINIFRNKASNDIDIKQPPYRQRNASLGIYSQEEIDIIKADIENIRTKFHSKEAEINTCTTNQDVISIDWN